MTARDILLVVIIPLALAEVGPWCGWLAEKIMPLAAVLRYGRGERAAIRGEEWVCDLRNIPGQLSKLGYGLSQLIIGSALAMQGKFGAAAPLLDGQSMRTALELLLSEPPVAKAISGLAHASFEIVEGKRRNELISIIGVREERGDVKFRLVFPRADPNLTSQVMCHMVKETLLNLTATLESDGGLAPATQSVHRAAQIMVRQTTTEGTRS